MILFYYNTRLRHLIYFIIVLIKVFRETAKQIGLPKIPVIHLVNYGRHSSTLRKGIANSKWINVKQPIYDLTSYLFAIDLVKLCRIVLLCTLKYALLRKSEVVVVIGKLSETNFSYPLIRTRSFSGNFANALTDWSLTKNTDVVTKTLPTIDRFLYTEILCQQFVHLKNYVEYLKVRVGIIITCANNAMFTHYATFVIQHFFLKLVLIRSLGVQPLTKQT